VNRTFRRLLNAADAVRTPDAAWLTARMLGWALVLPIVKSRVPLERLAALMWTDSPGGLVRDPERERQVARVATLSHRVLTGGRRDNCLERSLLAYRHLSAVNAAPVLVVGARSGRQGGVEGHVWVIVDGEPVHDRPAEIATYVPVTAFGARGRRKRIG
jgi:Transglutaminase-like superfamily